MNLQTIAARCLSATEKQMRIITKGTADTYNLDVEVTYTREFVPTVNDPHLAGETLSVARDFFGDDRAQMQDQPGAGSEDFARFLERVPGCFVYLGNGTEAKPLHNSGYDFDDRGLIHSAQFHAGIARRRLPAPASA